MRRRLKICIDMDGVIAKFTEEAIKTIKTSFDVDIKEEDITFPKISDIVWPLLSDKEDKAIGSDRKLMDYICDPGFFFRLNPYEDAIESINKLHSEGHSIIFLTMPLEWRDSSSCKVRWLKKYFPDMDYSVMMVSDMSSKGMVDCDVLIDDDPRALASKDPHRGICIARPWNKEYRENGYEGIVKEGIKEAAEWILDNRELLALSDIGGIDAPKSH